MVALIYPHGSQDFESDQDWGEFFDKTLPNGLELHDPADTESDAPDPDRDTNGTSLESLAELHFDDANWEAARGVLERLIESLEPYEHRDQVCRAHHRLALIAERLGEHHRALNHYLLSFEFDTTYLPTLKGMASAYLATEGWEDARRAFSIILIQHRDELTAEEVVELHFQLGELAMKRGQYDRAAECYRRSLDLDSKYLPALRSHAALSEMRGDWEDAFETREIMFGLLDDQEAFEQLLEQANLCCGKIEDPFRAIDLYSQALKLRPDDIRVLRALRKLFDETGQTRRKLEVLVALTPLLTDPAERRDIYLEMAEAWTQQGETTQVVDNLNRALDEDATAIGAFQKIEHALFETRAWPELARNYRRMIKRMPKDRTKARSILWRSLGALYEKALNQPNSARVAYEVVLRSDPSSTDIRLRLAALYTRSRQTTPLALAMYHELLETSEDPVEPARRLVEIYSALDQLDKAFCALSALVLLRAATETEMEAYRLLLKRAPKGPTASLTDELWRERLMHPACRSSIADIAHVLYRGAPSLFMESQRRLGLKRKEKVENARLRFFDLCTKMNAILDVDEVHHYYRPGTADQPRLCPGAPPVLFAGELHDSFKDVKPSQLKWIITRELASARSELAPVFALSPEHFGAAIEGACQVISPAGTGVELDLDPRLVASWKKEIGRSLGERAIEALRQPVSRCLENRDMRYLAEFLESAEHTVYRAALLMAQDAAVAESWFPEVDARVRALAVFCLSEDHFVLREKLGLMIS